MGTVSNQWSGLGQDWFKDYAQQGAEQAWGLLNNAPNAQASFVGTGAPAQMSVSTAGPAAQAAFTSAGAAAQAAREQNRYLPQVANTIGQGISTAQTALGTAQYDPSKMQQHLNPYLSGVNAEIARLGNENFQGMLGQINSNFTGAGQFGSARSMEMANKAATQGQREISGAQANAMNQAYNQAAQSYQNWGQMGIGAAQQAANAAIQGGSAIGGLGAQDASLAGQIGMYNTGQTNQQAQFNAQQANEIAKYNAGQTNQQGQFNASALNQGSQFNAGQANQMSTANMGAANATNQFNAGQTNSGYINNMGAVTNLIGTLKPGQTSYSSSLNMRKGGLAQVKRFRNGGNEGEDLSLSEDELLGMIRDRSGYELPEEEPPLEIPEGTPVPPEAKQLSPLEAIAQARNDRLPEVIEDRRALGRRAVEYAKEPVSPVSWNDVFDQWIKGGEAVARTGSRGAGWMASAGTAIAQDRARELEARKREGEGINTQAKLLDQEMGDLVKMEDRKREAQRKSAPYMMDALMVFPQENGEFKYVVSEGKLQDNLKKNVYSAIGSPKNYAGGVEEWLKAANGIATEMIEGQLAFMQSVPGGFTPEQIASATSRLKKAFGALQNEALGGPSTTAPTGQLDSGAVVPKLDSRGRELIGSDGKPGWETTSPQAAAAKAGVRILPETTQATTAMTKTAPVAPKAAPTVPQVSSQAQTQPTDQNDAVPIDYNVIKDQFKWTKPAGTGMNVASAVKSHEDNVTAFREQRKAEYGGLSNAVNAGQQYNDLKKAVSTAPSGTFGNITQQTLNLLSDLGLKLDPAAKERMLAANELDTAALTSAVLTQFEQKGQQTDKDFINYLKTAAGLGKNKEENKRIIAKMEHHRQMLIAKNNFFDRLEQDMQKGEISVASPSAALGKWNSQLPKDLPEVHKVTKGKYAGEWYPGVVWYNAARQLKNQGAKK